ncbi:adenylyl-sulfate kinase [Bailinhaonella thermotolerans]|uniref:adenylyl-sulfate kinase n=1 Tax=Bailinhaonella thermotolerans TaxID=1070861 RepID=UPI00268ACF91
MPDAFELADLELLLSGAFAPLTGFMGAADVESVTARGRLADGTPWPVPVTLTVPAEVVAGADALVLQDPEGVPLARLTITERTPHGDHLTLAGPVEALSTPEHGPFRRLRRTPAEVRESLEAEPLVVTARGPIDSPEEITALAEELGAPIVLMPLIFGEGGPAVVRASLAALDKLPAGTRVVAVPLAPRDDLTLDLELREHVAAAYGAAEHYAAPEPAVIPGPPHRRGLTVFFTGLSGSGKSTIARGLHDALLERGTRTVTLLDGDVVRRMLSSGLTFSRADRDLNIRRIGFVAAEVTRHKGLAICAPIAPYAAVREEVREMVEQFGDFVLVHVSTPLEECERRDRKGLYARARAGEIPEFTGISDPYEEPDDADLVIDTTNISVETAVNRVLDHLVTRGWVR